MTTVTAADLVERYGAADIAAVAVPRQYVELSVEQMEEAARGTDMSAWSDAARQSALAALDRIASAIGRAGTELAFYLRHRSAATSPPVWLPDDVRELARYHLYDKAGVEDSTIRLRYQDVIKRLTALAAEDAAHGGTEGDTGGAAQMQSNPRLFSRDTLRRL